MGYFKRLKVTFVIKIERCDTNFTCVKQKLLRCRENT